MTTGPGATGLHDAPPRAYRRAPFVLFLVLAAIGLVWSVLSISSYLSYRRGVTESARSSLTSLTNKAALSIDAMVREAMDGVDSVATGLTSGTLTADAALSRLRQELETHPRSLGLSLTYQPYRFDPKQRLYSAYCTRKGGKIEFVRLDAVYDYTKPGFEWFGPALASGPLWTAPYYDTAVQTFMVTYLRTVLRDGPGHQGALRARCRHR